MVADIAVQFATVFLGAYLAFAVEQLRERRAIQRVARTLLRQISGNIAAAAQGGAAVDAALAAQIAAVDRWLAGADLDTPQWRLIAESMTVHTSDVTSLLRAEPVTVMPAALTAALARLEGAATVMAGTAAAANQARERILVPWASRRPLTEEDLPLVQLYRSELADLRNAGVRTAGATADLVEQINAWLKQ